MFNVLKAAAQGIAPVCPSIEVSLKVTLQERRTHASTPSPVTPRTERFRAVVQGGSAALGTTPVTIESQRQFHVYITSDLELLASLQIVPYHTVASFTFGGRQITAQVTAFSDRRHNGWVRLDCHECRPQPARGGGGRLLVSPK